MATLEELQKQKDINSAKWHTAATQEEKDKLHQANIDLSRQMDALDGGSSSFDSTSGKWTRTPAAVPEETATRRNYDNSGYLRQQSAAEIEAALADLKGAYTKGMAAYDAQQDKLPERYRAAMNSAAAQSAMAKKAFDEQAAASGLNSGTSGQAALDASAVYQGNISNLQQSRASDMAEIDRAKAALTAQYETAVAKAKAEGNAELAKALYQEMIRVQGLQREDDQIAYDRGRDTLADQRYDQQYVDSRADVAYNQKLQAAATMAEFGNFNGYAELWGLDEATVNAMVNQYAQQKQMTQAQAARDLADWYAQYGDFSKLQDLGVNTSVLEKQQALALTGKTSGTVINNKKPGKTLTYQDIYDAGARSEGDAYNLLVNAGYSSTEAKATAEYFMDYLDDLDKKSAPTLQPDSGLNALNAKLRQVEDSGGNVQSNAAYLIKQYATQGLITEATAQRLLAQYGL